MRILIGAASASDRTRLEKLVASCGFQELRTGSESLARAADELREGTAWDLLVAAAPAEAGELKAVLEASDGARRRVPVVLCAAELTEALDLLAQRFGAKVCLDAHGLAPLRLAILRSAQEAEDRRRLEDAEGAGDPVRALVHRGVSDVVLHLRVEGDRFRFIEINPAFTKATGLREDQVVGKFVDEVIPEPSLSLVLSKYRTAIAEQRTVKWEEITPYPTGTKIGEVSITPLIDARGRCTRLVGTVQDVTEARAHAETIRLYADIVRAVQIGLTVWNVPSPDDPETMTLAAFNPAASQLRGLDLGTSVGRSIAEVMPAEHKSPIVDLVSSIARDGTVREMTGLRSALDGRTFAAKAFPLPGGRVGLAAEDVTIEARAHSIGAAEQRVLELVASGAPLRKSLDVLARAVENEMPSALASIRLLSPDGARLVHGAAPRLPEEFNQALDGLAVGPRAGSCGAAAALRRAVIAADVEEEPSWAELRDLARRHGLRACWSIPIAASSGRVLGTFAIYHRAPRRPEAADLDLIARISHVAGIAIQRHALDEQLRGLTAHIDAAREEERTGIARELHDQLGQALTVQKMDLAWISRRASSPDGLAREALLEKVASLMQQTDEIIQEVRRISAELRPAILDQVGLAAALVWKAQEFETRTHIACAVESRLPSGGELDRATVTVVFRVFQEALTNVVRHAGAARVDVSLEEREGHVVLEVRDDGRGITPEEIDDPRSLGLLGIRERARRLGGTVAFARGEPGGTVVTLRLPR